MQAKGLPGAVAKPRIWGVPLSAGLGLPTQGIVVIGRLETQFAAAEWRSHMPRSR
jgi:hypothetical protein